MVKPMMVGVVLGIALWTILSVLASGPAQARHHKKKKPTPTPSPSARLQNPMDAPDHAQLRPEDLMWLNQ